MSTHTFNDMIGKTMASVTGNVGGDLMVFTEFGGTTHGFAHHQDCCETVVIEDICGDLSDLVGSPIVQAEEVSSEGADPPKGEYPPESYTWTFYKFATVRGSVTVRWLGTSNGYYGEGVDYIKTESKTR